MLGVGACVKLLKKCFVRITIFWKSLARDSTSISVCRTREGSELGLNKMVRRFFTTCTLYSHQVWWTLQIFPRFYFPCIYFLFFFFFLSWLFDFNQRTMSALRSSNMHNQSKELWKHIIVTPSNCTGTGAGWLKKQPTRFLSLEVKNQCFSFPYKIGFF